MSSLTDAIHPKGTPWILLRLDPGSRGAQASLLCGMWDLPSSEIKPVSPALAGGFLTTAPPGKSLDSIFLKELNSVSEGKYRSEK